MHHNNFHPMNTTVTNRKHTTRFRSTSNIAEICLWSFLKEGQVMGFEFDQQRVLDRFIVDFYCGELKLAIELSNHADDMEASRRKNVLKDYQLQKLGIRLMRFSYAEVMQDIDAVLKEIEDYACRRGGQQYRLFFGGV